MIRRSALFLLLLPSAALAHVKWFEAYEVAQRPVPIMTTLSLPYFWFGVGLVLVLFAATTLVERRAPGLAATNGLDKGTGWLREHADAFMIAVLFAFFVALFAVGGTYLTPDLKTDAYWVPWVQLAIALLVIPRRTRPVAAVAIVLLWLATMRDYDLFHLYDYLALGLGLAGYLLLSGFKDGAWHDRRFAVLRWGIALALMWSSMEKFMYPQCSCRCLRRSRSWLSESRLVLTPPWLASLSSRSALGCSGPLWCGACRPRPCSC